MKKAEKLYLLKRLIEKGEVLCAEVCAMDWNLEKQFAEIVNALGVAKWQG